MLGRALNAPQSPQAMELLPTLRLACVLLLADLVVLAALARLAPALAQLGLVATWLEAGLRLPVLVGAGMLLAPGGPRGAAALVSLAPATFLTLRGCLELPGAPPVLLAMATPSWLALAYGAVLLALLTWTFLAPGVALGTKEVKYQAALRRQLALAWPEWPFLSGAFFFLVLAALGETSVPYCTGKALDVLRHGDGPTAFATAIGFVCLASASR